MAAPREARVDLIRGLCLLLIFVGHAHFMFSGLVQNGRGFSDASELFVLLAGFSCALAYYGTGAGVRPAKVRAGRAVRRARTIYGVHAALVGALFALAALVSALGDRPTALAAFRIFETDGPAHDFARALLLAYMPGELDILPLYVALLAAAFPLAAALHQRSSGLLLLASGGLWVLAGLLRLNLPNAASVQGHWYFSPFSWQFVFVLGLLFGWRARRGVEPLPYRRRLHLAALGFAIAAVPAGLALHLDAFGPAFADDAIVRALTGKTHAGPLRLLNALALLYILWHWPPFGRWARTPTARPILAAGRNSLPVFALGLVLSTGFAALPAFGILLPLPIQIALCLAGIAAQLAFAMWLQGRRSARAQTLVERPV